VSERDEELRRQIGTLWRTAMVGLDTVREVVVRSTQAGRLRVDIALLQRERLQLLQTLGEMVVALIDEGSFGEAGGEVPEAIRQTWERIKDVEGKLKSDVARAHDNAFGAPRGYEPEAAVDYGPEDDEHAEAALPPRAPRAANGRRPRKKAAGSKKKETSR
jgi:hypothetical protein